MRRMGIAALGIALLQGCAAILPAGDHGEFCRVSVEEKFDAIVVEPNELRQVAAAGTAAGAATQGALVGAMLDPRPRGTFLTPPPRPALWGPGIVAGIVLGTAMGFVMHERCHSELQRIPDVEADFETIVQTVDAGSLKRSVLAELDAQRPKCAAARRDEATASSPDAVIEITKFRVIRMCGPEHAQYTFSLDWRVVKRTSAASVSVRGPESTDYFQVSTRRIEDWLASPDQARAEIEGVLASVARWFVKQLTGHYGRGWDPPTLHVPYPDDEAPAVTEDVGERGAPAAPQRQAPRRVDPHP